MQEESSPTPPPAPSQPEELVPLAKLPTPPVVLVMAAVTIIAFGIGIFKFPGALSAGIAYERGTKSYDAGDYTAAVKNLEPVVKAYPEAIHADIELVGAYEKTDRLEEAVDLLKALEGKEATKEETDQLDGIAGELDAKLKKLDEANGGDKK